MPVGVRSAEEIKKDVVDQFYWDSRIDAAKVQVEVTDGSVQLRGVVPTYAARRAAQDDAWLIAGVKAVDNRLEVRHAAGIEPPTDREIAGKITNMVRWDPDLENADIDVTVTNGWVTLQGTVDAYWKKRRAEEHASSLTGVRGVTDELAVVPSATYEDELIADSITAALERDARIDVDTVEVRVHGGEVTLSGTVPSLAAFRAAMEMAEYTPGVLRVNNDLTIH